MKKCFAFLLVLIFITDFAIEVYSRPLGGFEYDRFFLPPPPKKAKFPSLNTLEMGKRFLKLGNTHRMAQNYYEAQKHLTRGLEIVLRHKSGYWIGVACEYIGYYLEDIGETEFAQEFCIRAIEYYDLYGRLNSPDEGSNKAMRRYVLMKYNIDIPLTGENMSRERMMADVEELLHSICMKIGC